MAKCRTCGAPVRFSSHCDDCMKAENAKLAAAEEARNGRVSGPMVDVALITTNAELPGYRLLRNVGVVRGISVRSTTPLGTFGAGIQSVFGGQNDAMEELCEDTRRVAYDRMRAHAAEIGANAVCGMLFDANELGTGLTEVLCYGTAVVAEPRYIQGDTSQSPNKEAD